MTDIKHQDPMSAALWESERHSQTLKQALTEWQTSPASDLNELESDQVKLRLVDQILFRFTKLQDAIGNRLIPATLSSLKEPFEEWPMIDRLNRLEKLGFINTDEWLSWREIRNRLAHEYPDHPEVRYAAILNAIEAASALLGCYEHWQKNLLN